MYLEKFPVDSQICFIKISTCKLLFFAANFCCTRGDSDVILSTIVNAAMLEVYAYCSSVTS